MDCTLAMNTSCANPGICQNLCCCSGDGGAAGMANAINAIGRWGTVMLATTQGKAVRTGSTAVGAKGALSTSGGLSGNTLILILAIVAIFAFVALRK